MAESEWNNVSKSPNFALLQENGDELLQENNDRILTEDTIDWTNISKL